MKKIFIILLLVNISSSFLQAQENIFLKLNTKMKYSKLLTEKLNKLTTRNEIVKSEELLLKNNIKLRKGFKGIFNIFDKRIKFIITEKYAKDINAISGYYAKLYDGGYAILSSSRKGIGANIWFKDKVFQIERVENRLYLVTEVNKKVLYKGENPNDYGGIVKTDFKTFHGTTLLTPATIKVLIIFTPSVIQLYNTEEFARKCKDITNIIFKNSLINTRIEIVKNDTINYQESGDFETDVNRLMGKTDGYMDNIHDLRTQYEADVCVLIVNSGNSNGIVPTGAVPASYSNAFAVVKAISAINDFSFAHELGHLLGCVHANTPSTTNQLPYNHGYYGNWRLVDEDISHYYCTVMSIISRQIPWKYSRINFFSNPNIRDVDGKALGTETYNNCARVIDETASIISSFEPRLRAIINGPTIIFADEIGNYTCTVISGTPPYSYKWEIMKVDMTRAWPSGYWFEVGENSNRFIKPIPNNGDFRDFNIRCTVTDSKQTSSISNVIYVEYSGMLPKICNEGISKRMDSKFPTNLD